MMWQLEKLQNEKKEEPWNIYCGMQRFKGQAKEEDLLRDFLGRSY